jgi:hypothetical protein
MLWQMGFSGSAKPGIVAERIAKENRDNYGDGKNGSVAKMVGRFNYVSFTAPKKIYSNRSTAKFDANDPIQELGLHWQHYYQAVTARSESLSQFKFANLSENELEAAENVFDGTVHYPSGVSFPAIPATYTTAIHGNVKTLSGYEFNRTDLFKAFASQEAAQGQWSNQWRITVGGADDWHSKGFNQIKNKYVYGGAATQCTEALGYSTTGESKVNHYDPAENLMAKAVWLSRNYLQCGGAFYEAFNQKTYDGTYTSSTGVAKLFRIEMGTNKIPVINGTHADDDYERLAKGVGGYNQGYSIFQNINKAWLTLLIELPALNSEEHKKQKALAASAKQKREDLDSKTLTAEQKAAIKITDKEKLAEKITVRVTAVNYALNVLHGKGEKLSMPYRQYIWKVGDGAEAYCFAYGEQEWVSGENWNDVKDDVANGLREEASCN